MRKPQTRERSIPPDEGPDRELDVLFAKVDRSVDACFLAEIEAAFAREREAENPTAA